MHSIAQNQFAHILFLGTAFLHHSHSRGLDGQELMWPLVSSTPQLLGHLTILYPQLVRWSYSCNKKLYYVIVSQLLLCTPRFSPAKCSFHKYKKTTLFLILSLLPCPWTDPQVTFQYTTFAAHNWLLATEIKSMCINARKILGIIFRHFYKSSSPTTLIRLYTCLVRPILEHYPCGILPNLSFILSSPSNSLH